VSSRLEEAVADPAMLPPLYQNYAYWEISVRTADASQRGKQNMYSELSKKWIAKHILPKGIVFIELRLQVIDPNQTQIF